MSYCTWIDPEIGLGAWLDGLDKRVHRNKASVALANKIARIAWAILTQPGASYNRIDPRFGLTATLRQYRT